MTTIRDEIKKILAEIWQTTDLQGEPATEYAYKLSALLGNVGEKIVEYEKDFIAEQNRLMMENDKTPIARVKLLAQNTESYAKMREVQVLRESMMEAIRSLKSRAKALQEEYQVINR